MIPDGGESALFLVLPIRARAFCVSQPKRETNTTSKCMQLRGRTSESDSESRFDEGETEEKGGKEGGRRRSLSRNEIRQGTDDGAENGNSAQQQREQTLRRNTLLELKETRFSPTASCKSPLVDRSKGARHELENSSYGSSAGNAQRASVAEFASPPFLGAI